MVKNKDIESLLLKNNKTMLSTKVEAILNKHIVSELEAAYIYKAMYAWCEHKGYNGSAIYMHTQYKEEIEHMDKLYKYLLDRLCLPKPPAVKPTSAQFTSLKDVMQKALDHEILVEEGYKDSLNKVWAERDHTTFEFLQWYAYEQIDEVAGFSNIVDRLTIAGNDPSAILMIDKELATLHE